MFYIVIDIQVYYIWLFIVISYYIKQNNININKQNMYIYIYIYIYKQQCIYTKIAKPNKTTENNKYITNIQTKRTYIYIYIDMYR